MLICDQKGRLRALRVEEGAVHSVKKWAKLKDLVSSFAAQSVVPV